MRGAGEVPLPAYTAIACGRVGGDTSHTDQISQWMRLLLLLLDIEEKGKEEKK
jgi:hypothetical protein